MDLKILKDLRAQTGAGMSDCQSALAEANDDLNKAVEILRKKGQAKAVKKGERTTNQGLVDAYLHANGKIGAMVQINCETDFVARNTDFKVLVRDIAMQVAAMNPQYISSADVPSDVLAKEKEIYQEELAKEGKTGPMVEKIIEGKLKKYFSEVCLLEQAFVKDDKIKISDLLNQAVLKMGENIKIKNFSRFEL